MKIYASILALVLVTQGAHAAVSVEREVYLSINGQDTTGDYDLMVPNPEDKFLDGVRFDFISGEDQADISTQHKNISSTSIHQLDGKFSPVSNGQLSFFLKSLIPSIKNIPLQADAVPSDLYVAMPAPQVVPLEMNIEMVDFKGNPSGVFQATNLNTTALDFQPITTLPLSNYAPAGSTNTDPGTFVAPSDPINFALGAAFDIYAFLSEIGLADIFAKNSTDVTIQAVRSTQSALSIGFINENIADKNNALAAFNGGQYAVNSTVYAKHTGVQNDVPFGLASFVKYELNDGAQNKKITTPGGSLGLSTLLDPADPTDLSGGYGYHGGSVQAIMIGADIEGSACHKETSGLYSTAASSQNIACEDELDLSNTTISGSEIIRNLSPSIDTELTTADLDITSDDVIYFKNTNVTLGNTSGNDILIEGVKTIIIEDGNLLILKNIKYKDNQSSLGIILLNSNQSGSIPNVGNVFIHKEVQQVSANLYADGGLLSTRTVNDSALSISENDSLTSEQYEAIYDKQLIWTGNPNAQKTLGGFIFNNAGTNYDMPWGSTNSGVVARRYDLHFLRRYSPIGANGTAYCAQSSGACDTNQHATVIRPDNRLNNPALTPPGFSTTGLLDRQ